MMLTPTITFADCPQLDVICVPGGAGINDMVNDEEMLAFLRKQAEGAKYVTSVCTGSLVLGAAGLLKGYRAATHWSAMEYLSAFGATPTKTRVCADRNRITGGGVTAGIDFALTVVSTLVDRKTAEAIQLGIDTTRRRPSMPARPTPRLRTPWQGSGNGLPRPRSSAVEAITRAAGKTERERISTEKGRPASRTAFPYLTAAPHLTGDLENVSAGAYLPAILIGAAAHRVSRDLWPGPSRWFPISVR